MANSKLLFIGLNKFKFVLGFLALFFLLLFLQLFYDFLSIIFTRLTCTGQPQNCNVIEITERLSGNYSFVNYYWRSVLFNSFAISCICSIGIYIATLLNELREKLLNLIFHIRIKNLALITQKKKWIFVTVTKNIIFLILAIIMFDLLGAIRIFSNCHEEFAYCNKTILFDLWSSEGRALSFFSHENYLSSIFERTMIVCLALFLLSIFLLLFSILDWYQLNNKNESELNQKQINLKNDLNKSFGKKARKNGEDYNLSE